MSPTSEQLAAMTAIWDGADILDRILAVTLRDCAQQHPDLVRLTEPMGTYGVREQLPYFGAILTPAGRAAVILATAAGGGDQP